LAAKREKQCIIYKGSQIKSLADFKSKMLEARKQQTNIFKVLKELKIKGEITSFPRKQKLKKFLVT
jgi:hypothetical protein